MERTFVGPVDDQQVAEIFSGNIRTTQEPRPRIVRLFLSSTVGDVDMERERLYHDVFPTLSRLSNECGLQFHLVDMQHGLPLDEWRQRITLDIASREVALCQQLTVGPSIVTLLAQTYGHRPLPFSIPPSVFQHIATATAVDDISITAESRHLVTQWYRLDDNAVPSAYRLIERRERLPDIYSDDESSSQAAKAQWQRIESVLAVAVRSAVAAVVIKDRVVRQTLLMSLIEAELTRGVLLCPDDPNKHIIWMKRFLISLKQQMVKEPQVAQQYIDTAMVTRSGRQRLDVDTDAQRLLNSLRDDKMVAKYVGLDRSNICSYELRWISGGIDPDKHKLHREYFQNFSKDALQALTACLKRNFAAYEKQIGDALYQEVLQHVHDIKVKSQNVQGFDDTLQKIDTYLLAESPGLPLVVHGVQGSGKSACIGQAILRLRERYGNFARIVVRSIEATADSRDIRLLLLGLCKQLRRIYTPEKILDESDNSDSFRDLLTQFPALLTEAQANNPLFIILDGLDHLRPAYGALNLEWLPLNLPAHVHVVVTTAEEALYRCYPELQNRLGNEKQFVQIPELSSAECQQLTEQVLAQLGRTLTTTQMQTFMDAAELCQTPQYIKLCCEHVLQHWRSDEDPSSSDMSIPGTSRDVIFSVFERVERRFGWQFVNHALGYITAGKHGISEPELLDILSCDEKIMDALSFRMSLPERRFPFLLWCELRQSLGSLLSFSGVDNCCVLRWNSRLVQDAAEDRYLTRAVKRDRHSALADFFLGKWHGVTKPYRNKERVRDGILATDMAEDRHVMAQPLTFGGTLTSHPGVDEVCEADTDEGAPVADGELVTLRYNMRKLNELPYQLVESGRLEELRDNILSDYSWMKTKLKASSVASLIADYNPAVPHLSQNENECRVSDELRLLRDTLVLASPSLRRSSEHFGPELIARLTPLALVKDERPFLSKLLQSAQDDNEASSIVPLGCPLKVAGQHLISTLRSHSKSVTCVALKTVMSSVDRLRCGGRRRIVMVTGSEDCTARYWDVFSGDMSQLLEGHATAISAVAMDATGQQCATSDISGQIRIWTISTGVCEAVVTAHKGVVNDITMLSNSFRVISTGEDGTIRFWNSDLASSGLGKELFKLQGHEANTSVSSVALSSDEMLLFTGGADKKILVWGQLSGELQQSLSFHADTVTVLTSYPDRPTMLLSGSADRTVVLWDTDKPQRPVYVFRGHVSPVTGITVGEKQRIISCASDSTVRLWDGNTGKKYLTIPVSTQPTALQQCVHGRFCVAGQDDGSVAILDLEPSTVPYVAVSQCHRGRVTSFVTHREWIISGGQDGSVLIRSMFGDHVESTLQCPSPVKALALLPEKKNCSRITFLSAHGDGQFHQWTQALPTTNRAGRDTTAASPWHCVRTFVKHRKAINDIVQYCGSHAITASDDSSSLLWEIETGRVVSRFAGHRAPVTSVVMSQLDDTTSVVTASKDGTANVYRLPASLLKGRTEGTSKSGTSTDAASHFENILIPDLKPTFQLRPQPTSPLKTVCMDNPCNGLVAMVAGGQNGVVSLYNTQDGKATGSVECSRSMVTCLRRVSGYVAAADSIKCISLYNMQSGTRVASVMSEGNITALGSSEEHDLILWGDSQGRVYRAQVRLPGTSPPPSEALHPPLADEDVKRPGVKSSSVPAAGSGLASKPRKQSRQKQQDDRKRPELLRKNGSQSQTAASTTGTAVNTGTATNGSRGMSVAPSSTAPFGPVHADKVSCIVDGDAAQECENSNDADDSHVNCGPTRLLPGAETKESGRNVHPVAERNLPDFLVDILQSQQNHQQTQQQDEELEGSDASGNDDQGTDGADLLKTDTTSQTHSTADVDGDGHQSTAKSTSVSSSACVLL